MFNMNRRYPRYSNRNRSNSNPNNHRDNETRPSNSSGYTDNQSNYSRDTNYNRRPSYSRDDCGCQPDYNRERYPRSNDYGPEPFAVNIENAAKQNNYFRTALWTGEYLQLTLMSIEVGGDIGLEMHPDVDQFIRIEQGEGLVMMGDCKDNLDFKVKVCDDYAFIIPAGVWHNLVNTGDVPIKLYSIYAPPQHPHGTVHRTQKEAMEAENH